MDSGVAEMRNFHPRRLVAIVTMDRAGARREPSLSSLAQSQSQSAQDQPDQSIGTAGIAPMRRPSLLTRIFIGVVAFVERLNLAYSKAGNPPIYDNAVFPWTRDIEREWRAPNTQTVP